MSGKGSVFSEHFINEIQMDGSVSGIVHFCGQRVENVRKTPEPPRTINNIKKEKIKKGKGYGT